MTADPRTEARKRALIAGAVHRGEVPRIGTLVRWKTKSGVPGKGRFTVDQIDLWPGRKIWLHITSIRPSDRRAQRWNCWVRPEMVIMVEKKQDA